MDFLNKIFNEDNLITMKRMPDKFIDLIITDPPYGVKKADWDDVFPTEWITEALRVSKRMLVMTGNSAMIKAGNAFGEHYKDCIVLHATNGMTRSKIAFGNWIPTLAIGEWNWKARPNYIGFNVKAGEVIEHPSPKPIQAIRKLLHYYADEGELIYDPFMGSGTTAIACADAGFNFVGSEIEEKYCNEANKRLHNHIYSKPKLFI